MSEQIKIIREALEYYAAGWVGPPDEAKLYKQALKALDELQKECEWQPIETAPGMVSVLVSYPISGKPNAVVTAVYTIHGWRGCAVSGDDLKLHGKYAPTHWQPLPEPPEE